MSDLIDREEALKAITFGAFSAATIYGRSEEGMTALKEAIRVIKALPSAEPKKGKWIPHSERCREYIGTILAYVRYDYWFCDTCGYRVEKGWPIYNFCPNCGARMEAKDE